MVTACAAAYWAITFNIRTPPPPVEDLYFYCFNPSGNVKIFVLTPLRKVVLPHLE